MQTRIGTSLLRVLALAAVLALSFSCASYKDISVTSCEVASLSPNGLRAVDAVLSVGVHNPTVAFTLSDIAGTVRQGEDVIATFEGGPVSVEVLREYADPDSEKYQRMVDLICQELNFTTLRYHRLDDLLESVEGMDRECLCTYCWNGRE